MADIDFNLFNLITQVGEGKIEIYDAELRRQLNPTTADLRFADSIVKSVLENQGPAILNSTGKYLWNDINLFNSGVTVTCWDFITVGH